MFFGILTLLFHLHLWTAHTTLTSFWNPFSWSVGSTALMFYLFLCEDSKTQHILPKDYLISLPSEMATKIFCLCKLGTLFPRHISLQAASRTDHSSRVNANMGWSTEFFGNIKKYCAIEWQMYCISGIMTCMSWVSHICDTILSPFINIWQCCDSWIVVVSYTHHKNYIQKT